MSRSTKRSSQEEQETKSDRLMEKLHNVRRWWIGLIKKAQRLLEAQRAVSDGIPDIVININQYAGRERNPGIFFEPGQSQHRGRSRNLHMFICLHTRESFKYVIFLRDER